jgi:hypothetical protein
VLITVLMEVSALVIRSGWTDIENRLGPIRAIAVFTLAAPLAVLGLRRPAVAGRLLLVLGVATVVLSVPPAPGSAPMGVVGTFVTISGLLYALSNRFRGTDRGRPPTAALSAAGRSGRPT